MADVFTQFSGTVRQLDVVEVMPGIQIIFASAKGDEIVARTEDARIISIVEIALVLNREVAVAYTPGNPNVVTRVTLSK